MIVLEQTQGPARTLTAYPPRSWRANKTRSYKHRLCRGLPESVFLPSSRVRLQGQGMGISSARIQRQPSLLNGCSKGVAMRGKTLSRKQRVISSECKWPKSRTQNPPLAHVPSNFCQTGLSLYSVSTGTIGNFKCFSLFKQIILPSAGKYGEIKLLYLGITQARGDRVQRNKGVFSFSMFITMI